MWRNEKEIKRLAAAFLIFIITISLIGGVAMLIQVASADGAASTEEVWIEYYVSWAGQGPDTDDHYNIDDNTLALYHDTDFNFTLLNVDTVSVTALRTYVKWDGTNDAFTRDWRVSVWDYTSQNDGGARLEYEDWVLQNKEGDQNRYVTRTLTTEWELSGTDEYFFGFGCSSGGGVVRMYKQLGSLPGSGSITDNDFDGEGNDPFDEWGTYNGTEFNIQISFYGYNKTATQTNQYYGNATHYEAERLINYSFPVGASLEEIRFTYPADEQLVNITKAAGGQLTTEEYTDAAYNESHRLVTIPEATINNYGGEYIVWTSSYGSLYTLNGLYYENGTFAENITATIYYTNGSTEDIWVNGSVVFGTDEPIDSISWEAGQDARPIDFKTGEVSGTYYLFTPEDTYGVYQFDINDYSGRLGTTENYLEIHRAVNGTWRLVERRAFTGIYNPVPALMVLYEIYKIQIVFSDTSVYEYGYFYPGVDLAPTLAITEIAFSDQARTTYTYIEAEAQRPNATRILVIYNDTTPGYSTTEANLTITYRNGTLAYSSVIAGSASMAFNWYGAHNVTDYVVRLTVHHQLHGTLTQSWILDYSRIFGAWPDFDELGELGGVPTGNLLAVGVGLVLAGACSYASAALAPFMFMAALAIFTYLGAGTFSVFQLEMGFALAVLLGLAMGSDPK